MNPSGIRKLYYSIREVSELVGQQPHVLRYWETEFEWLRPKKNRAGNRAYTSRDIEIVTRIHHLLKHDKYTIEGARQVLEREMNAGGDGAPSAPREELLRLRAFLTDLLQRL